MPTGCLALPRACRRLPALLGLLALSGCQLLPGGDFVPGGIGRVDILAPQVIAPASARAWYQGGERVAVVDEYAPHCELEVNTVSPSERVGPFADVACSDAVYYEVEYRLASETQPDVRLLRCRQAFTACGPESHHYPSRDVVQQTLGEGFFIE
jgi:hypothetical protein